MTGAKATARKYVSKLVCPNFKERQDEYLIYAREKGSKRHDEFLGYILKRIQEWLRLDNCTETQAEIEGGRIDGLLQCGGTYVVVEVKSYPFADIDEDKYCNTQWTRTYIADYEQLLIYAHKLRTKLTTNAKIRALLIYRGLPGKSNTIFIVEPSLDEHLEEVYKKTPSGSKETHEIYKPGPECLRCVHDSCPIRTEVQDLIGSKVGNRTGKSTTSPTDNRNSVEALYQELFLTEWCLARHGTRCVKCGPFYFALSQTTLHLDDMPLTHLHIQHAINRLKMHNSLDKVIEEWLDQGLLIEEECDKYNNVLKKLKKAGDAVYHAEGVSRLDYFLLLELLSLDANLAEESYRSLRCYRTFHGKVSQLLRNLAALPSERRTFEGYYLPTIVDRILPPTVDIRSAVSELSLNSNDSEGSLAIILNSLTDEKGNRITTLTRFQLEAIKSMLKHRDNSLVILTAPPGAGKTVAFMTYALLRALKEGGKVIIMYPTKKLALQQLQQLYYTLEELTRELKEKNPTVHIKLAVLDGDSPRSRSSVKKDANVRSLKCEKGNQDLRYNRYGDVTCGGKPVDWFTEVEEEAKDATIIVTNHNKLSSVLLKGSLGEELARGAVAIIVDEAHTILDPELLDFFTALLHRMFLMRCCRAGESGCNECNWPVLVLSSATITSSGLPLSDCISANPEKITLRSVGALERVASASSESHKFAKEVKELLLGEELANKFSVEVIDYYEILARRGADVNTHRKLTAPMVLFTMPEESYTGTVEEAVVSLALASGARRDKRLLPYFSSVIFIDSKETIGEIAHYVTNRLLKQEKSPADKTLTKPLFPGGINTRGYEEIKALLLSRGQHNDYMLSTYLHLPLFCTRLRDLKDALKTAAEQYENPPVATQQNEEQNKNQYPDQNLTPCYINAYKVAEDLLGDADIRQISQRRHLLIHHADLKKAERYDVERRLEQPGSWDVVLATSTLELGVNLRGVAVVGQLGVPPLAESAIQRFGRGGRDRETLHTALGILFARHTGEDVALINEDYAISRLFAYKRTPLQPRNEDRIISIEELVAYQWLNNNQQINLATSKVQTSLEWLNQTGLFNDMEDRILTMSQLLQNIPTNPTYPRMLKNIVQQIFNTINKICSYNSNDRLTELLCQRIKKEQDVLRYSWEVYFSIDKISPNIPNNNQREKLLRDLGELRAHLRYLLGLLSRSEYEVKDKYKYKVLTYALVPPMPHPYLVQPTIVAYKIDARGRSSGSVDISGGYVNARPLKVDRYR